MEGESAGRSGARFGKNKTAGADEESALVYSQRFADVEKINQMDTLMGFEAFSSGPPRVGWMINMSSTYVKDSEWPSGRSAVDYYFIQEDGSYFKATLACSPYFFVKCKTGKESEVEDCLRRKFDKTIERMDRVMKEDLDLRNHLSGLKRLYLRLSFRNVNDMEKVRRVLQPIATRNGENYKDGIIPIGLEASKKKAGLAADAAAALDNVVDLREHDIPYALRVSIDHDICVGLWYNVKVSGTSAQIQEIKDKDVRPDPIILAFDIETSKSPLKFPDSSVDPIMMISYMINGQGFLITNREIVSQDIEDFEYTPKPDFPGLFSIFNEPDEKALLNRFFAHIQLMRPTIVVTYNGDFFDWPYVEARALAHGMDMEATIGFKKNNQGEYWTTQASHMDCFRWVKRDSYLPAGSQGLKAVTSAKLGYDPLELDPEQMTPLASSDPQTLANYSVSDAVATYYLYMKYVHPFIFSLCNIIPLSPDDVLRKGSGTLCETLLMREAFHANVIMPNKHADDKEKFHSGHLLENETYIGGHVEALEAGVFRSDIPYRFRLNPETLQTLINDVDRALTFSLKAEGGVQDLSLVTNYDEVKKDIVGKLEVLRDSPNRNDRPLIYHLDVAAMYPNIILSNRLQPTAMVDEATCAMCDHNRPGMACQRRMTWSWRGEMYTAKKNEYRMIKTQLEGEQFPTKVKARDNSGKLITKIVPYHDLPEAEQKALLQKRLAEYSQKVYRRVRKTEVVQKESIVCQKEHAFYIDTVRSFRDRRYDYKNLHKKAKKMADEAQEAKDAVKIEECKKLVVLYDSLQLAHKCILNSFYGYVMRKGARWYSMEMAGIVCYTGSSIIQLARQLVERIGRPLELDTDGIWCMLPWDFPQGYVFTLSNGKKHAFDYPCVMLNHLVHDKFTNDQYHTLTDLAKRTYVQSSENSIFFEIDGPYRAMIIPSSTEEGKQLKKRYAVFNENGSLAELKGFEVKRRGELKFVKVFQTQIFKVYLEGSTLTECYAKVAEIANYWLDILHGHGKALEDHDLVDLVSENRSMSRALEDYGEQKSTSICTARRLAEFLGDQMVKDAGLACKFIISKKPLGQPVATRAVPVAIFSAEETVKRHYLKKWLKEPHLTDMNMRSIIDWDYYLERLGSMCQKLIVIPAALQSVANPCPRVAPPDWMLKGGSNSVGSELNQERVQSRLAFSKLPPGQSPHVPLDMEDMVSSNKAKPKPPISLLNEELVIDKHVERVMMESDYGSWIGLQKNRWRRLWEKIANPHTKPSNPDNSGAFGRLIEHDKDFIVKTPWQIILIEPTSQPGEFKVWAVLRGASAARLFRLHIPRKIYLHFKEAVDVNGGLANFLTRVYRKLPDGHDPKFLYEFVCEESSFVTDFHRYSGVLSHPNLEGIYEADIPLEFECLIGLGSCAMVNQKLHRLRDAQPKFGLDDFSFCTTSEVPYLVPSDLSSGSNNGVRFLSILHFGSDNRHVILFGFKSGQTTRYRLIVVEAGMRRQLPANPKTLLPPAKSQSVLDDSSSGKSLFQTDAAHVTIEVDMFADVPGALRSLQRSIQEQFDAKNGPIIILQNDSSDVLKGLSTFERFPTIQVPHLFGVVTLPPLDWQRWASRKAFEFQAALDPWIDDRLSICRYAHIPLGNLRDDAYPQVVDVFFARALRRSSHLIWWHPASLSLATSDSSLAEAYETEEAAPSILARGIYRTVCVEADLTGLAINAIMEHNSIAIEDQLANQTMTLGADGKMAASISSGSVNQACAPLLAILRKLLADWLRDHIQNGQVHAQHLAATLYRWLKSPHLTHLYSSRLRCRVQSLINRSLGLLVAKLHHIGCMVIHCDSNRIVLRTTKHDLHNAMALMKYVGEELKRQDAFGWIDFIPVRYWKVLAWMDVANHHGYAYDMAFDDNEEPAGNGTIAEPQPMMRWCIADYLPPVLQPIFKKVIQEYIFRIYRSLSKSDKAADQENTEPNEHSNNTSPKSKGKSQKITMMLFSEDGTIQEDEDQLEGEEGESCIDSDFIQLFLRVIRETERYLSKPPRTTEDQVARQFPVLTGSHLSSLADPLFELVKACGAVFDLDNLDHPRDGEKLIKLAFGLLSQREFSDDAIWKDPCMTYVLKDVICKVCARCRDLDFCRDPSLAATSLLSCDACGQAYDMEGLESEIIALVTTALGSYQQQDLACRVCGAVKADTMQMACCRCTAPFRFSTIAAEDMKAKLGILEKISQSHGMLALRLFLDAISLV